MSAPRRRIALASLLNSDRGALGLLMAVFLGNNWQLLAGKVSLHWDAADQFEPYYNLVSRLARSGHFLFWNPFCSGGSPDFVEPQYGAFSPILLLYGLIFGPGFTSFHLYWLSIWLLGGMGMYVLARALAAPPWGALLIGLSFVFSGYYLGHAEHVSLVCSYSFVPWIVWRVRAALTTGRQWPACQAGALWGLSALAGNPAITIPAILFAGMVSLAWVPAHPGYSWRARWLGYAATMLLLVGVGTMVVAPAYLGFRYEVAGFSDRSLPLPRELVLPDQSLGFNWLSTLISPMIAFVTLFHEGWPQVDLSYVPIYFGAILPVLAIFVLWQRRASGPIWIIALTGLFFLGCALGNTLPFRAWLYDLLPPTRFIRHPPMFRGFFILAVAMLAAPATRIVEERLQWEGTPSESTSLRPLAMVAVGCAVLSALIYGWILATVDTALGDSLLTAASWHLTIAWVGLMTVCIVAVRRPGLRRYLPVALVLLAVVDLSMAFSLSESLVYIPTTTLPAVSHQPLEDLGPVGFARVGNDQGNANLYGPRPVFISYTAMTNALYAAWGQDPVLLHRVVGPYRVWFSPEAPVVPSTSETFAAFQRRVHQLNRLILVRNPRADLLHPGARLPSSQDFDAIASAPAAEYAPIRLHSYHANDLALSVNCPRAGFLLLTDRWTRSWQATVNGRVVPVDGGDFLFRLVPVVAGENRIEMKFQVAWIYPLVILSWGTLMVVGVGTWWRTRQPAQRGHPAVVKLRSADETCIALAS